MKRFVSTLLTGLFLSALLLSCKSAGAASAKADKEAQISTPPNVGSNKLSKKRQ